jgi:putative sterol carrier protein
VVAFLADEWFALFRDAAASWPPRAGVDASLQFVIAGSPAGKVQFVVRVVEGSIAEIARGKSDAVDCTLQCSYADACSIAQGKVDRDVAYMRGDLKIDGNYVVYVLRLRPLLESDDFAATCQSLRDRTEF